MHILNANLTQLTSLPNLEVCSTLQRINLWFQILSIVIRGCTFYTERIRPNSIKIKQTTFYFRSDATK